MIVFLRGKDAFRVTRRRSFIRDAFREKYPGSIVVVVRANDTGSDIADRIASAAADDLFGSKRLVDIRDACRLSEDVQKGIAGMLKIADPFVSLLFSETETPAVTKNPLAAYLGKHADRIETFDGLSPREAEKFLFSELSRYPGRLSISRSALSVVTGYVRGDSARLASLAETLAAFRDEGEVTVEDVSLFVSPDPVGKAFDALDALLSGDRSRAISILLREARNDGTAIRVMGLLAWQVRELFRVREAYDRGIRRADDIARATGMKPFVAGKLLSRIGNFTIPRLRSAIDLLADLDVRIKTGRVDGELALTIFSEKL